MKPIFSRQMIYSFERSIQGGYLMFDSHVHTSVSCDSEMLIEDAIKMCKEKNTGIVITDHMDINPFRGTEFTFNVSEFFSAYERYRSSHVLLGIELGLRVEAVEENRLIVDNHPFDFILCSTHAPYDMETPYEYYDKEYYEGLTKKEAYLEYLSSMLKGVQNNPYFDALAHIDYITRYSPYEDTELYYDEFKTEIDHVLKAVADLDKSLEISTRRIHDKTNQIQLRKIYCRFAELGGQTVTIGSDAHTPNAIGKDFELALEIAKEAGLEPVYYKKRQRVYMLK